MSWICRKTHPFFRPFFAAALILIIAGCANTGLFERSASGRIAPEVRQAVPEYVRNLPKSLTGNMNEYTVFGKRYSVLNSAAGFTEQGIASWYGQKFHGRKTSSGEIYDMHAMTAAHKHLPLPTFVRVTNLENNLSVVVKVNDRGPFVGDRIIDLSFAAAMELDMDEQGTANVHVEALSTHLVAENDISSKNAVVDSFGKKPEDNETPAPEVIEPTLAAVPLQDSAAAIEQFETEVEPDRKGEAAQNTHFTSNNDDVGDGFVELVANADTGLIAAPAVKQLKDVREIEVQKMTTTQPAELSRAPVSIQSNYFIQLGAFGHAPNAEALVVDIVEKTGLTAFIEKDEEIELFRVKMGPFEKGERLDTAIAELASFGIENYTRLAVDR